MNGRFILVMYVFCLALSFMLVQILYAPLALTPLFAAYATGMFAHLMFLCWTMGMVLHLLAASKCNPPKKEEQQYHEYGCPKDGAPICGSEYCDCVDVAKDTTPSEGKPKGGKNGVKAGATGGSGHFEYLNW